MSPERLKTIRERFSGFGGTWGAEAIQELLSHVDDQEKELEAARKVIEAAREVCPDCCTSEPRLTLDIQYDPVPCDHMRKLDAALTAYDAAKESR